MQAFDVPEGKVAFWWLGQMGYALKFGRTVVYIDAFLSAHADRQVPPLLEVSDVVNADLVLGTHDHGDHIDRDVWPGLAARSPQARLVVPGLLVDRLATDLRIPRDRFLAAEDGQTLVAGGLRITAVAAAHEFLDRDPETGQYPYLGYVLEGNGVVVYHSGDCCQYEGLFTRLAGFGRIDVAFLPINGRSGERYRANCIGNMTYQEAVDLAGSLRVALAVPSHYDMFSFNGENPRLFLDYLQAKYPGVECWIGQHGCAVLAPGPQAGRRGSD